MRPFSRNRIFWLSSSFFAIGCSLINSFDDVAPLTDPEAGYSFSTETPETSIDSSSSDAAADAGASRNFIVVAGEEAQVDAGSGAVRKNVLSVLDTSNGKEVGTREAMTVAGIAHDDARDLFYVFETEGNFIPAPTDKNTLHLRKLNSDGSWTEIAKAVVPTLHYYNTIAVTTQRLSYVGYSTSDAAGPLELVTLDTTNGVSVLSSTPLPLTPVGLIGHPSTTGPGGRLTVASVRRSACLTGPNRCPLELDSYLVPNSGAPSLVATGKLLEYLSSFGVTAWGSIDCQSFSDLFVLPRPGNVYEVSQTVPELVNSADPPEIVEPRMTLAQANGATADGGAPFKGGTLRRLAVDDHDRIAFVVETNADLSLHAISLGTGGYHSAVPLGHSGQAVYYDPASSTVFAPFNQGSGFTFSAHRVALKVQPNGDRVPEMTARGTEDWNPPADLRPMLLGIRKPYPVACN